MAEIQRSIHTIKGQGSTFDFPAVTLIAHRMEDFIESVTEVGAAQIAAIQTFVDCLREILESRENPGELGLRRILQNLPINAQMILGNQAANEVRVLLVMPKSMQRKIIAQELTSCGLHVVTASTPTKAIEVALRASPKIIVATHVNEQMSGPELLRVFSTLDATRDCRLALLSSNDAQEAETLDLPEGTAVIHKGEPFFKELGEYFMELGVFGQVSAKA